MESLQVIGRDEAYVNNAIYNLSIINDYQGITKPEAQNNINYILDALKNLEKVSVDVSDIRLKLDELLKIWQMKWNLAVDVVSEFTRYRLAYNKDPRKIDSHLNPSFPQLVSGNPEKTKNKPILVASVGSLSGLLNAQSSIDMIFFYHTDHLGTPIMMTDKEQEIVWEIETMPFGEELSITGSVTNNLRFPGQ